MSINLSGQTDRQQNSILSDLPYNPIEHPRELCRHYISATETELENMMSKVGVEDLKGLFSHLPKDNLFTEKLPLPDELSYEDAAIRLLEISSKTNLTNSFIGDLLPAWATHPIVDEICKLRQLTTSYTPYQPERSQGTLVTHWIYQCVLSALTGFEAINTSLYDRSAAIFEAIGCARRSRKRKGSVLLAGTLFKEDISFLKTHAEETCLSFVTSPICPETGRLDYDALSTILEKQANEISAFVFPQVNSLGILEEVDFLTNLCSEHKIPSIAVIDPMHLVTGGLKPPAKFGEYGADFIAGEAQHLAIPPSFGGPGLGLFGCRYNDKSKQDLRNTPGRFIGKAKDSQGRDCFVMVLSTREQHIRKEKATSNVCSNQAFLATIAGANLLAKGENGLKKSLATALNARKQVSSWVREREGVDLAFPQSPAFTDLLLCVEDNDSNLLSEARELGIHLGVEITERIPQLGKLIVKLSFSDLHNDDALKPLKKFLLDRYPASSSRQAETNPPVHLLRIGSADLPT